MIRLLVVTALVACSGGGTTKTPHPDRPREPPRAGSTVAVAESEVRGDEPCSQLIAHAVALGEAERPAEQRLTDAERSTVHVQLREAWAAGCKQMTSKAYACALAAASLAELEACSRD